MSLNRKYIAEHIESLIRQRKLGEDEMLHLIWLCDQEENVKITRSHHRRLLRLEKYSDETMKKVTDFLKEVEKYESRGVTASESTGNSSASTAAKPASVVRLLEERQEQARSELEKLREQEMKRRKVTTLNNRVAATQATATAAVKRLPRAIPTDVAITTGATTTYHHTPEGEADAALVSDWLMRTMKLTRAQKKVNPKFIAPDGDIAMPIHARVVPKKKKRKNRRKSRKTSGERKPRGKKVAEQEDEDEDEDEEIELPEEESNEEAGIANEEEEEEEEDAVLVGTPLTAAAITNEDGAPDDDDDDDLDAPVGFEMENGDEDDDDDDEDDDDDGDADDDDLDDDDDDDAEGENIEDNPSGGDGMDFSSD